MNIIEVTKGDNVNTNTRLSESKENDNLQDLDIEFFLGVSKVLSLYHLQLQATLR